MDRTPVKSSTIKAIGYDEASKTLEVEFKNGGIYQFAEVGPEKHRAFMDAPSKGKHFQAQIRDKHKHVRSA